MNPLIAKSLRTRLDMCVFFFMIVGASFEVGFVVGLGRDPLQVGRGVFRVHEQRIEATVVELKCRI